MAVRGCSRMFAAVRGHSRLFAAVDNVMSLKGQIMSSFKLLMKLAVIILIWSRFQVVMKVEWEVSKEVGRKVGLVNGMKVQMHFANVTLVTDDDKLD